jgi:hypothetical protein
MERLFAHNPECRGQHLLRQSTPLEGLVDDREAPHPVNSADSGKNAVQSAQEVKMLRNNKRKLALKVVLPAFQCRDKCLTIIKKRACSK